MRHTMVVKIIYEEEDFENLAAWKKALKDGDICVSEIILEAISGGIDSLVLRRRIPTKTGLRGM